ncbi:PPC domain-containing protein [Thermoleptolyngbya sp.]
MSISNQDNTLRGARNLGRLGTRRINGYVGSRDPVDFVKFTLGDVRELSLSIGRIANRASSARITLRDARGAIIRNFRTSPRNITFRDKFPPGTYFIGIQRLRGEVNYRMTAAARPAEPGERLSTARDIGVLAGTYTNSEFVGTTDPADIYRFTLNDVANLQARVTGTSANTRVELIRDLNNNGLVDSGEIIASGTNFGAPFLSRVNQDLPQGTYFVRITPSSSNTSTQYRLELVATPFGGSPPPDPGNTLATARSLGAVAGTVTAREYVGVLDDLDAYRFTLNDLSNVQVSVQATSANTRIQLVRDINGNGLVDDGEVIVSETNFSSTNLSRFTQDLPAGTYFITVASRNTNASTLYELNLVATPFGGDGQPDPGNLLSSARNLGPVAGTVNIKEYVGVIDDLDAYRFTLNDLSNVQVNVQATSANTRIQLVRDINNNGLIDNGEVIISDTNFSSTNLSRFTQDLPAGTYFITVASRNASDSTLYEMNLVATPFGGDGQPDPGNTIPTARNIGVLSNTYSAKEYVGTVDPEDFYRFTLNSTANLQARVQGTSGNTIIELIRDTNGNGLIDSGEIIRSDTNFSDSYLSSFVQNGLAAGTYFFRVRPRRPSVSTNYTVDFALV